MAAKCVCRLIASFERPGLKGRLDAIGRLQCVKELIILINLINYETLIFDFD